MSSPSPTAAPSVAPAPPPPPRDVPFGVNEVRLNARQWLAVLALVLASAWLTPRLWQRIERFDTGPDYRLPYQLSKDYWLYERRARQVARPDRVLVVGDSVIWGEYVRPDGTLSHFLNRRAGTPDRFVNLGINGMFPLALEGLVRYYGGALTHQKVLLHCNVLWLTSPKADLSTAKEEQFNHARLVPQFYPRIPCYRADASERLSAIAERHVEFFAWVGHLQSAYFNQKSILNWTLEDDGQEPPHYPNARKNPFAKITLTIPTPPANDPDRGPDSPRHKPWAGGATTRYDWVGLNTSIQWAAFQRLANLLRARGNQVLVMVGPFNEHMIAPEDRPAFHNVRDGISKWLAANGFQYIQPETLPTELYADASHPLTQGYELLARKTLEDKVFHDWMATPVKP